MHATDDVWLLTVLLWLGLTWLIAYLISGLTFVTRRASPQPQAVHGSFRRRLSPLPNEPSPINPTAPGRSPRRLGPSRNVLTVGHSTAQSAPHSSLELSPVNRCCTQYLHVYIAILNEL